MERPHWADAIGLSAEERHLIDVAEREQRHRARRRLGAVLAMAGLLLFMVALSLMTADVWNDGVPCGNALSSADASGGCDEALDGRRAVALMVTILGLGVAISAALYRWLPGRVRDGRAG
jgi:hypothetical protein